jgi:hypothetical protein
MYMRLMLGAFQVVFSTKASVISVAELQGLNRKQIMLRNAQSRSIIE